MSDYEEEHFPVGIRTSFSSSFDADWRESAAGTDFAPIRRSFSEFYRGERIIVDAAGSKDNDEFRTVLSNDEIQNSVDIDSCLDYLNGSNGRRLTSDSSAKHTVCTDVQHGSYRPEVDMQTDSSASENCSVNGYDSRDDNDGPKSVSHTDDIGETAEQSVSLPRTGLVEAFAHSQHISGTSSDIVRQRTVSEIRNNIPDVGNVKSCSDPSYEIRQSSPDTILRGEFARFWKRSPGVAKRLEATTPSKGEIADLSVFASAEVPEAEESTLSRCLESNMLTQPVIPSTGSVSATGIVNVKVPTVDIEETSAQKESSKQLECSNIVDAWQISGTWDSLSDDFARRTDPFRYSGMLPDAVLFISGDDPVADQTIYLSPELTECDSDNVSTLEENSIDDVVDSCLPVVEDGLSCSDTDEIPTSAQHSSPLSNLSSAAHSDAAAAHKFPVSESEVMDFFSGTAYGGSDTSSMKETDPVEKAIRDIRLAMERSKGLAAGSPKKSQTFKPPSSQHDVETVWVSRADENSVVQADNKQVPHRTESAGGKLIKENVSVLEESSASQMPTTVAGNVAEYNTDEETDELLERQYNVSERNVTQTTEANGPDTLPVQVKKSQPREALLPDVDNRTVLIEGVLFRTRYLGSTKISSECNPSKARRMLQAQEAVGQIKLPEEESQPSTEVDLFVSAEKIMVLDTGHRDVIMDHSLQTISYIADIGDLLVIMVRLAMRPVDSPSVTTVSNGAAVTSEADRRRRRVTICCHVFESDEAQLIAQSIGQAFQVAYAEFLRANGIDDPNLLKDVDYQEVLNQQQIFGEELSLFSSNEKQKEVTITKLKGEPLGIVLVESGWGSMLPTVVLANLSPCGPAARTGRLNIGDQIMSIDGVSLVGLPLSVCQSHVKAARQHTIVRLKLVSCAPVVEVLIKRPHVKYQLGFSVQNGVICSLLRGGIGERGGVRVGHRIIEINGHSMVAMPHERIVHLLATSVGEIHMKTMQTSVFRLLTGQDTPHYI